MTMVQSIWMNVKKRPILIAGGIAGCSLIYMVHRRRNPRLPDGDIWLDMDLSRPLLKSRPGLDLSFIRGEPNPICYRDAVDALEMASKDDRVRGILGRFSYRSWDRVPLACVQELREAIEKFRESTGEAAKDGEWEGERRRFSIAVADTFGEGVPAVGEYFLASAFEKVMLQRTGFVGLTGLGSQQLFFRGFFDKYGIKPEVFAREEYKSFAENVTEKSFSGPNREAVTFLMNGILDHVADAIAHSRGFTGSEAVRAIMHKCPLPAMEALDERLIDGIMYPYDADRMVERFIENKPPLELETTTPAESPASKKDPTDRADDNRAEGDANATCTRVSLADYIKVMRAKEAKMQNEDKYVAVMDLVGTIVRHADSQDGNITSSSLCERLRKVSEDESIGAVVLRIDSGGGSAIASDSIAAAVQRVRQAGKPIVCSMGDVAASGGYMIASACDKIVAQPTTITGSIGVVSLKLSIERLLHDWGIEVDSIELSENSLAFSPFKELTPKQRSVMDKRVGEVYQDFVSRVAEGRKLPVEEILRHAKGRVWTGQQAKERGLVDELGGLNSTIAIAKKAAGLPEDALAVVRYPVRPTLSQMFKRFRGAGDKGELESFDGIRGGLVAFVEALFGEELVQSMEGAVKLLAAVNDVATGKIPKSAPVRGGRELEIDDMDLYQP